MPRIAPKGKENAGAATGNARSTKATKPTKAAAPAKAVSAKNSKAAPKATKATKGAKKATKRVAKDPNAPKRPMTAYFFFVAEKRAQVKAENPTEKLPTIAKMLGAMWRELPDAEKKSFLALAEKDKQRYAEEMQAYGDGKEVAEGSSEDGSESDE